MSIEALLDLIRLRFSPSEGQSLLRSLQQDPLVWQFVRDEEKSLPYFESAPADLLAFSPGRIAVWLIEQTLEIQLGDFADPNTHLPDDIKKSGVQAFETLFNTGLPPADLMTAGLLALTLRERWMTKKSWNGISEEIFLKREQYGVQKNFEIWRTPLACIYQFCQNFNEIAADFLQSDSPDLVLTSIPLVVHTILSNPMESDSLLDQLYQFSQMFPIELQLETLKWLDSFHQNKIREKLAKNLIQTKKNIDFAAKIFSEIEVFETSDQNIDPLDKQVRYTLPEDINRIGAFHYYSGNQKRAADSYRQANKVLDFINAQTLFQSLATQPQQAQPAHWMRVIQSMPNSKQAWYYFIQSLIKSGQYEEATNHLDQLPGSTMKQLLQLKLAVTDGIGGKATIKSFDQPEVFLENETNFKPNYYAFEAKTTFLCDFMETLQQHEDTGTHFALVENLLAKNMHHLPFVSLARNYFEKNSHNNKAIELTSYLERIEPEQKEHRRSLARLYSKTNRWQETFNLLQNLVKDTPSPEINDLECFAEAALKTSRVDVAISICQNILKQNPKDSKALILLGQGYMHKGDIVKAIQHMEQVVELLPEEPETWETLARLWSHCGQQERAMEILHQGVIALPNEPSLLRTLGSAYLEQNAPADALTHLKRAFALEPKSEEGRIQLAEAQFQLGKHKEAYQLLEAFMDNPENNPSVSKLLGNILVALDEPEKAEPLLLIAANHAPDDLETLITASDLVITRFESINQEAPKDPLDQIEKVLQKAMHLTKDQHQLKLRLADLNRLNGKHQIALDEYSHLSEINHEEIDLPAWRLQYGLGKAALALGHADIGIAALQDAASKQPENLLILHTLAEAYQTAQIKSKADRYAKSALILAPQDINNILWYAAFKTNHNAPEDAVKALKEALLLNPDQIPLKLSLAKSLISTGTMGEARDVISQLISDSNASAEDLHQVAYICVYLNELELAANALENAYKALPEVKPSLIMDLAVIYSLLNRREQALELLNTSSELIHRYPQVALLKSDLLCGLGQYSQAFDTLTSIQEGIDGKLPSIQESPNQTNRSPLLFNYDFSMKGYLFRLGLLHREKGNIREAQQILSDALSLQPDDAHLQNATAEAYLMGLDFTKALEVGETLTPSAEMNQDQIHLICSHAEILLAQDKTEQASQLFNQLSQNFESSPRFLAIQSRIASTLGEHDVAQEHFEKALTTYQVNFGKSPQYSLNHIFRQTTALNSIAEAALLLNDHSTALEHHELAWEILKNQPYINLRHLFTLIKTAEAQQICNIVKIINHSPGEKVLSEEKHDLSRMLIETLKDFLPQEDAMCLTARTESAFTGKWPLSLSADACLISPDEAAAVLLGIDDSSFAYNILEAYPDESQVLQAFGIFALRYNQNDGKLAVEKALSNDTVNPINHALLAMLNVDNPQLAFQSIKTALNFWPDEAEWHTLAADLSTVIGDLDEVEYHINEALKYQPENAHYWQKSADLNLSRNDLIQAKEDLKRSASFQSKDPAIWLKISDVNNRMGNLSEAIENIKTAGDLDPNDIKIAAKEVELLLRKNKYQEAEQKAEAILNSKPDFDSGHILLASAQASQGKFDQALATLSNAADKKPDNISFKLESLKIRKDQVGIEAVLPELVTLAQDNANHPETLITLTDWLIQTNRLEKAAEAAQTILRIIPEQAEVHLMLGRLQRKKGQLDQAIAHLSDAIVYNPNLVDAYIELGKTYQERRNLDEAIRVFQEGAKANGSDPRPYFFAGMALKECKDYSNAEMMLKKAKEYSPNDPNIIRQLGVITALNLINNLREVS